MSASRLVYLRKRTHAAHWTSASQRGRSQSAGAGFVPRSGIAELVDATCVCEAGFDSNRAPNNLFANEPSLSAQGTGQAWTKTHVESFDFAVVEWQHTA